MNKKRVIDAQEHAQNMKYKDHKIELMVKENEKNVEKNMDELKMLENNITLFEEEKVAETKNAIETSLDKLKQVD